jgi:hypothetical protein
MKISLLKFIDSIKVNQRLSTYDESSTKQALILPILQILGWNVFNVDEVTPEFVVENRKVDYALKNNNLSEVFIEVKSPKEDLEKHQDQLLDYSFRQGVELAILTNGLTWWLYLPTQKGSWHERKFYTIDIYQQDSEILSNIFIEILSKQNVLNGDSIKNAINIYRGKRREKILFSTIPESWNKMISEPDPLLIELFIEVVEKMCGYKPESEMILDFLKNNLDKLIVSPEVKIEEPPKNPPGVKKNPKRKENPPVDRISQEELIPYIIALLYNFGGSAEKSKIDDNIYNIFKHQFSDPWYHELVSHGVERWKHNIAWAKEIAIQHHKLIKPASESGRGIWELTEKGKEYYQRIKDKINI